MHYATLLLTKPSDETIYFGMPKIDPKAEKGTIRTFKEVAKLAELTEEETNVDAHAVMLLVMRFYRELPPKLRLAIVTQDPNTFSDLLRMAIHEMAEGGPFLRSQSTAATSGTKPLARDGLADSAPAEKIRRAKR